MMEGAAWCGAGGRLGVWEAAAEAEVEEVWRVGARSAATAAAAAAASPGKANGGQEASSRADKTE